MPIRGAKNIRDLIYYQYAKIIMRRGFFMSDGKEVKNQNYGFMKETFRDLNQEWNTDGTDATDLHGFVINHEEPGVAFGRNQILSTKSEIPVLRSCADTKGRPRSIPACRDRGRKAPGENLGKKDHPR